MAQIARNNEAERATDNVAELGKRTTDKGADVAREVIERTEGTARRGFETVQQAARVLRSRLSARWPVAPPRVRPRSARCSPSS
jgi:hypothetical protein